jgi:hypothetical protein
VAAGPELSVAGKVCLCQGSGYADVLREEAVERARRPWLSLSVLCLGTFAGATACLLLRGRPVPRPASCFDSTCAANPFPLPQPTDTAKDHPT